MEKPTFYFKSLWQSASIKKKAAWRDGRMKRKQSQRILCEVLKLDGLSILVLAEHWASASKFLLTRLSASEERWIHNKINSQDQWNTDRRSETQPWHKREKEAWLIKKSNLATQKQMQEWDEMINGKIKWDSKIFKAPLQKLFCCIYCVWGFSQKSTYNRNCKEEEEGA